MGMTSKIAGEPHTLRESWDPNRQICFAVWLTSTGFLTREPRRRRRRGGLGMTSKIAGEPHTLRESWDPNRQICFAVWLTSTGFCATGAR